MPPSGLRVSPRGPDLVVLCVRGGFKGLSVCQVQHAGAGAILLCCSRLCVCVCVSESLSLCVCLCFLSPFHPKGKYSQISSYCNLLSQEPWSKWLIPPQCLVFVCLLSHIQPFFPPSPWLCFMHACTPRASQWVELNLFSPTFGLWRVVNVCLSAVSPHLAMLNSDCCHGCHILSTGSVGDGYSSKIMETGYLMLGHTNI